MYGKSGVNPLDLLFCGNQFYLLDLYLKFHDKCVLIAKMLISSNEHIYVLDREHLTSIDLQMTSLNMHTPTDQH